MAGPTLHDILHDLKGPLMSIEGFAELLLHQPGLSEQEKTEFLHRIIANIDLMQQMLEELQKMPGGNSPLKP